MAQLMVINVMKKIKDYIKDQIQNWLRNHPSFIPTYEIDYDDIEDLRTGNHCTEEDIKRLREKCGISNDD